MSTSPNQTKLVNLSLLVAGIASLALLYKFAYRPSTPKSTESGKSLDELQTKDEEEDQVGEVSDAGKCDSFPPVSKRSASGSESTPLHSNKRSSASNTSQGASTSMAQDADEESEQTAMSSLHSQIEEIDRRGKKLFKEKKYLDAAEVFSEALDLIDSKVPETQVDRYKSLNRQVVTLMNNRSAMYEKGGMPDLALHDCEGILEIDPAHAKARTRKLRILESLNRHNEALVECCALQLKFMQDNRDKLRMGIPVTPPVPQSKIEDLMGVILPDQIDKTMKDIETKYGNQDRPLPSCHTILQLLQSFTGYNSWMAKAAKDGSLDALTATLEKTQDDAKKVEVLLKRGRRYAFHRKFELCKNDFEMAYALVEKGGNDLKELMDTDIYARVLEWTGTCRHLRYDLDGAIKCYESCSDADPTNAAILVKRAGVQMDSGKLEEAMKLFDTALSLDPTAVDALLHRANLRMLQQKPAEAKSDLERCLELRPDHIFARLRLATISMALEDLPGATKALDEAERIDPQSSDVHSYRGELYFAQGQFIEARAEFDRAIECDAGNPTPYVNAALAVMNTPTGNGGPPDIPEAIRLLEKAIEVDPQFHNAYVHLGQLKLSMATDLSTAKEVIALYDKGLDYCRTADELKDIVSMRILTVAQVDAASSLKMDTLNMQ